MKNFKKLIPKKSRNPANEGPKYPYFSNPRGHVWEKNPDGSINIFAYEDGEFCNGPRCIKCGLIFCHHCSGGKTPFACKGKQK